MIDFFISDTHFGHGNVIKWAERPFSTVDQMDAALLERYREDVGDNDVVAWVGDVSFRDFWWTKDAITSLPGHKILVRGNHDGTIANCLKLGFDAVVDFMYLQISGHKVTMAHMPPLKETADKQYPERRPLPTPSGEFVIHGHTHEKTRRVGRRIHVGVDAWDFRPVPMEKVVALIKGNG